MPATERYRRLGKVPGLRQAGDVLDLDYPPFFVRYRICLWHADGELLRSCIDVQEQTGDFVREKKRPRPDGLIWPPPGAGSALL